MTGYLFFTAVGILWGFKKPLAYFSFDSINSVSYTSVLQRTFNLNVAVADPNNPSEVEEIEFAMVDQADYAGIDEYIKVHGLHDASMAEQRRAKRLNVNKPPLGAQDGDLDAEDEETELQKAERALQDQEDDEEEDYDPGSDEDSDGSGASQDEEDGENESDAEDEE